jgi:hypothetical protein
MNEVASDSEVLKKKSAKGEMEVKEFIKEFMEKRMKFHNYDTLK